MDPYVVLGVDRTASPDEIDAAYARRRRLHDPATQGSEVDRAAAERYRAELGGAYRAVLGTAPPTPPTRSSGPSAPAGQPVGAPVASPKRTGPSAGRDWLPVLGAVIVAYILLQVPLALDLGFGGAIAGWAAAIGVMIATLVRLRGRRA